MAEDAGKGAVEAAVRQFVGQRAAGPERAAVGADEDPRAGRRTPARLPRASQSMRPRVAPRSATRIRAERTRGIALTPRGDVRYGTDHPRSGSAGDIVTRTASQDGTRPKAFSPTSGELVPDVIARPGIG